MSNEEFRQQFLEGAKKKAAELCEKHDAGELVRLDTRTIIDQRVALEEYGAEDFVRRAYWTSWIEKFGAHRLAEEVRAVLEETHGQPASEPMELEEGATLEDMEEARLDGLYEETVLLQTIDIDNDTILDIDRRVVERLKLFYSFEENYFRLCAAINPEYKEIHKELEDKTSQVLFEEVLGDPGLRDNQREAVFEILELLQEYAEEADRWKHEEGLDQLADEQRLLRFLAGPPPGEKTRRREARRELRKAKRKGKKRWQAQPPNDVAEE